MEPSRHTTHQAHRDEYDHSMEAKVAEFNWENLVDLYSFLGLMCEGSWTGDSCCLDVCFMPTLITRSIQNTYNVLSPCLQCSNMGN